MAMRWNWKKICYGSGAIAATLTTVFALSPQDKEKSDFAKGCEEILWKNDKNDSFKTKAIKSINDNVHTPPQYADRKQMLKESIEKSRKLCERVKDEMGLPGLTIAVSVNGKLVWQEGFGYASLENNVKMKPGSIMRIASISKSMTMAMLAKFMEDGKIDIDKPIQTYLPNYPEKCVDGEKVTITTRHLLSHLSGIRHYTKKDAEDNKSNPQDGNVASKKEKKDVSGKSKKKTEDEMSLAEYFIKERYATVEDSMKLFQDDELFHKPGTKFLYTTHGWTVVSRIVEKLADTEFPKYCRKMFNYWGLQNTYLDIHEPIIYNRACYYTRKKDGIIINSPYVDNSYKWAGGGFLSTVGDLNQFANILLYSIQAPENSSALNCDKGLPKLPYLKRSTIETVWTGNPVTERPEIYDLLYALGFQVGEPMRKCVFCKERDLKVVRHSGAAVGASSELLLVFPLNPSPTCDNDGSSDKPEVKGVVVSMITNLTSIGLARTAYEVATIFREFM